MAQHSTVTSLVRADDDARFFQLHPDRKAHIRTPGLQMVKNTQRSVHYEDECRGEFWSLGDHDKNRRRILLCRVGADGTALPENKVLKIPFLLFADETVEDRDDVLLPIFDQIMKEQVS